jgi:M6 family metalloprotease-like protein
LTIVVNKAFFPKNDRAAKNGQPLNLTGKANLTVLPVFFPDIEPILPTENISSIVFGNISEYFFRQSYQKVWLAGVVHEWIQVSRNHTFYDRGSLHDTDPVRKNNVTLGIRLFRDAVIEQLTWSVSNFTEHILLLYAGSSTIHPHHCIMYIQVDGESRACEVSVAPELFAWDTIAHEIAHGFGLHDLYNKLAYSELSWGRFIGSKCLMANPGMGYGINEMCAYSRMHLGWISNDEILDININSTCRLLSVDQFGVGMRVVRIPIDKWRFYLVEGRSLGANPGVLLTRVDVSRSEGGYGRVEVVRSAAGVRDVSKSLFLPGERFVDTENGLSVRVIGKQGAWYDMEITFGDGNASTEVTVPSEIGSVIKATSITDTNGTSHFAFCAINGTTGRRMIHLFYLDECLEYKFHTPFEYESLNPVLVAGRDGVLLIYEVVQGDEHHVFAQFGNLTMQVSGGENARNPTAAWSGNGLYVAYENHTSVQTEIVVRKGNQVGWENGIRFMLESHSCIKTNDAGTPQKPLLRPANNYALLAYLRTLGEYSSLEVKWDIDSPEVTLCFDNHSVAAFNVAVLSEYRALISISDSSLHPITRVYYSKHYYSSLSQVFMYSGTSCSSMCVLGLWEGHINDNKFRFERIWNRWYDHGRIIEIAMENDTLLDSGFCSLRGSTALYLVGIGMDGGVKIQIWAILSTGPGAESQLTYRVLNNGMSLLALILLAFAVYVEVDRKVRAKFARRLA